MTRRISRLCALLAWIAALVGLMACDVDRGGVPVLLFHSVCADTCVGEDTYAITTRDLDRLLTSLEARGYTSISIADFAAFREGKPVSLPRRPVLLTFDDGRSSAWLNATPVLRAHHAHATMFVITERPSEKNRYYMSWQDLHAAQASGVWDLELHAHAGHVDVPTGAGSTGPFYAWRAWSPYTSLETHEDWRARVRGDIEQGEGILAHQFPGREPHAFAVPYGDYGQKHSNDEWIPVELESYFAAHYPAWFVQGPDPPFAHASTTGPAFRYLVTVDTSVGDVLGWIADHEER